MKKHPTSQEWADEFKEFASAEELRPPVALSDKIMLQVQSDLNPEGWKVFAKLSLIHLVVGTVTLLFCPQFGINLAGGMGMMALFMRFGDQACMLGCGAVFMAGSALTASLLLTPEEVRKLRSKAILLFPALTLFSIGVLICVGGGLILNLGLFWMIGSVLGGVASLELGWLIRSRVRT